MSQPEDERLLQIRIPSRPERLRLVRAAVAETAAGCGCSERCIQDIVIAVSEACQNVIRHAYQGAPDGEIILDIWRRNDTMLFQIVDFAPPVDVSKVKPRPLEELRPGGLGTHFIQECMDEAGFRTPPKGTGNLLRMVKRIS